MLHAIKCIQIDMKKISLTLLLELPQANVKMRPVTDRGGAYWYSPFPSETTMYR